MNNIELYRKLDNDVFFGDHSTEFIGSSKRIHRRLTGDNKQLFISFVEDLNNLSKKAVGPLTATQTSVIRKRYGVYDDGKMQTFEKIGKFLGFSTEYCRKVCEVAILDLYNFHIICYDKVVYLNNKISTIDVSEEYEKYRNLEVGNLDISGTNNYVFYSNGIYTIGALLTKSIEELDEIPYLNIKKLYSQIHDLGLSFIDELSIEEKTNLINNKNNQNKLANSSIYLLNLPKDVIIELKKLNINTIGDYINYINICKNQISYLEEIVGDFNIEVNDNDKSKIVKNVKKLIKK